MHFVVAFLILVVVLASVTGMGFGNALILGVVLIVIAAVVVAMMAAESGKKMRSALEQEGGRLVDEHLSALVRRYRQLVRTDDYGLIDSKAWEKERLHFFNNIVMPALPPQAGWEQYSSHFNDSVLDPKVRAAFEQQRQSFADHFNSDIDPIDYEHFCAERLRKLGWDAKVTKSAGDQGADIVARCADGAMVVQCKRYAKTVGNKAVQEIVGAMRFYDADYALVIATNGYTKAAHALADVNGVILIHHDDLVDGWVPWAAS